MGTAAVVLAAGASRRLGEPKQLVIYRGRSLVERAVEQARGAGCDPVVVVTGADAARVETCLAGTVATIVRNERWPEGQGTSVAAGVGRVRGLEPSASRVLMLLCDQPLVPVEHLRALVRVVDGARVEIAATRHGTSGGGVPACFASSCFDELAALEGAHGARSFIRTGARATTLVDAPEGDLDVDTPGDLRRLRGG